MRLRKHFEARDGVGKDVDPLVGLLPFDQFRRHVRSRAGSIAWFLKGWRVGDDESKVNQLHDVVGIDDHVSRADVAVDPAGFVKVLDALAELQNEAQSILLHNLVLRVDQKAEADSFDKFHDEKLLVIGRRSVLQRVDNVLVFELNGDLAFARFVEAEKACFEASSLKLIENFDGDLPARHGVVGTPDFGHAALANSSDEIEPFGHVRADDLRLLLEKLFEEIHRTWSHRLQIHMPQ